MPEPTSTAARIFGDRVREERQRLGLTQDELAHLAGMNVSNYGKIERGIGNPVLHTIVRLAVVVGVDPSVLVTGMTAEHLPPVLETFTAADYVKERTARRTS
ncbi:helix-turn-helix transcriptional regulator [Frigoribacterium sp. CFBP9039]|uniref:helix-turn-helix domain-containing protein n=1 Tax=Frigoribacterium TaxID=96492 RepID=UPI00178406B7|nr:MULTISPECIES: helix-turn-helix transcriptional regulator [Frigoribacterium]MBD8703100.1 helix-turn-helix transcriptional regulator [Frigoribacterium sp. CFBP 13712]MCJ0700716.1 helix-turn-helix domain-containing protein [Frigoribacterium faeni]MDY0890538.1 helix-turn-helix transcriptional regulator [Frigoribacterium sp. CFBP9030]MDY0944644.1 helix-turn-helix transcriptional regulator [Frigoribacterium sp. CFBP9039]